MTLQKHFRISRDNVYKNYRMRPRQQDKQESSNVSFKKNLKVFKIKLKNEEEKNELFLSIIELSFSLHKNFSRKWPQV